jgi:hypothetical protein
MGAGGDARGRGEGGGAMDGEHDSRAVGWLTFAGVMLLIGGAGQVLEGLWAFRFDDTVVDLLYFDDNLAAWGWFHLGMGIVLVVAGFQVIQRSPWARVVGVVAASLLVLLNFSWLYAFPLNAVVGILLGFAVIYALAVYGAPSER